MLPKHFLNTLFLVLCGSLSTVCHIQMASPPPRRSKYSEYYVTTNQVNYNLMAPLGVAPDHFSFPCKGFPKGPSTTTVRDNKVIISLEGTAIHGGGHCQFGITFDDTNFLVLETVLDTCLVNSLNYQINLPDSIPNGRVTIFWSWINRIGNREYYMDCADITLERQRQNSNSIIYGKELFIANLPGYPTIPEFPNSDTYSGKELLDNRRNIGITLTSNVIPPTQRTSTLTPTQTSYMCQNDVRRCDNNAHSTGYLICDNNVWVNMPCAPGTKCITQKDNTTLCDFI